MLGVALHHVLWDAPSDTGFYPPISEEILMLFVAHCSEHLHLKAASIKVYLAGIRIITYKQAMTIHILVCPHLAIPGHALQTLCVAFSGYRDWLHVNDCQ
jgi:hypothetical protein